MRRTVITKTLGICMGIGFFLSAGMYTQAASKYPKEVVFAKDDIASGINNGCKWAIDKNGTLTVRSVDKKSNLSNEGWKEYKDQIKKVDIDVPYSSNLQEMFQYCHNITDCRVKIDKTEGSARDMFAIHKNDYSGPDMIIDVTQLNTSGITDMNGMFMECRKLVSLDLSTWDTSNVTNMGSMFNTCVYMHDIDLSNFDTSNVTNMGWMFDFCGTYDYSSSFDVSSFDTSKVTNMETMFMSTNMVTGYENWDVSNVRNMRGLFQWSEVTDVDLSKWNTPNLTVATGLLDGCDRLKTADLSGMDMSKVDDICTNYEFDSIVSGCTKLISLKTPKNLKIKYTLPERDSEWYRDDTKKIVTSLPKNLDHSITIKYNVFDDIYVTDWQFDGASYCYDANIMQGKKKKANGMVYFDIESSMTRAEFVQTLYSLSGSPAVSYTSRFKDVQSGKWYTNAILWAANNKIVSGKGQLFDVNGKVTREEMAVMLYNYAAYKKQDISMGKTLTGFTDYAKADSWAVRPLKWAVKQKIINGKNTKNSTKLLDPLGNATRGEGATILKNYMKAYSK